MKQLKGLRLLFFMLSMVLIASCDDDVVGKWDPMKWEYKNVSDGIKIIKPTGSDKDHAKYLAKIVVTKSGTVDIVCKNYKGFWFEDYPGISNEGDFRNKFSTDNCDMEIEGNTIHCEFTNIEGYLSEEYKIVVTAGDVFFSFKIDIN